MTVQALGWICLSTSLLISLLVGFNADALGRRLGLRDFPDAFGGRKRHDNVTPLVGGVAVVLSFLAACGLTIGYLAADSAMLDWQLRCLALTVGVMAAIGLADDRFGLSPVFRLVAATGVLVLAIVSAPDFRVEFLRFGDVQHIFVLPPVISVIFTLVCLIGLLNAVNMADGKNGLVITLALIWTGVLFFRNPRPIDPVLFATAGSLVVMLAFNMRNRLFLGDSGSYGISAIFGLLAIYAYNHSFATFAADQVATMFAVPVFDTIRLMTWRMRHGRSPFAGDRNHLHHYLHARWGWPVGLVIYGCIVAIPNGLSLLYASSSALWFALSAVLYVATLMLAVQRGTFREGFSS